MHSLSHLQKMRIRAKAAELLAVKDFDAAYALKLPDIRKDVAEGQALNIRSTPTYFINNVRHDQAWDVEALLTALEGVSEGVR